MVPEYLVPEVEGVEEDGVVPLLQPRHPHATEYVH